MSLSSSSLLRRAIADRPARAATLNGWPAPGAIGLHQRLRIKFLSRNRAHRSTVFLLCSKSLISGLPKFFNSNPYPRGNALARCPQAVATVRALVQLQRPTG